MSTKNTKKIGRRDLLKVMTAGMGGLVVSAFLPNKWTKPVVEVGVSPVHAQASITTGTITGHTFLNHAPFNLAVKGSNLTFTWFPMAGAVVTVDGMPLLKSTSDANGLYTITNVPVGSRTISCVPPQNYYVPYDPASADFVPVTVTGVTDTIQDFKFIDNG